MRLRLVLLLGLAGVAGGAARAEAQTCQVAGPSGSCSVNVTTSITIPVILRLTVSSATTTVTVNQAVYDAGFTTTTGPTVTVKANQAWRVQISSASTLWTAANTDPGAPARTTKPLSDLQWRNVTAGGTFAAMTGTATNLFTGSATGGSSAVVEFKTFWSYLLDTPGAYSVPVTITVISP